MHKVKVDRNQQKTDRIQQCNQILADGKLQITQSAVHPLHIVTQNVAAMSTTVHHHATGQQPRMFVQDVVSITN